MTTEFVPSAPAVPAQPWGSRECSVVDAYCNLVTLFEPPESE